VKDPILRKLRSKIKILSTLLKNCSCLSEFRSKFLASAAKLQLSTLPTF